MKPELSRWVLAAMLATAPVSEVLGQTKFVFILADDLGYMDIGANNPNCFYETPHIDSIAETGMRFTDGYAASPVCSPTRFSIMTGRYPTRAATTNYFTGTRAGRFAPAEFDNRMPLEEVTIAEALKERGYATFFAGKWHLGPSEEFWPEGQGFDVNKAGWTRGGPYQGGKYFSPYGNPRLEDGPEGEHLPHRLAAETAAFIEQHRDEPFLAFLSFYSVHTPLMAPDDLVKKYQEKVDRLGIRAKGKFEREEQNLPLVIEIKAGPTVVTTEKPRMVRTEQSHAVYAAMVESMDRAVGLVLAKLEELELDDETAVIFMSDNGGLSTSEGSPTSNRPLRAGKGWLYEGGVREPWIVRWPGVTEQGVTCSTPVISTDFYPTILEMAGADPKPEQHLDGVSLVPLLRGEGEIERDGLFWHYPHYSNQGGFPGGAIRVGDYKLLERLEDGRVHLFNLSEDPGELSDLAEAQPLRVSWMRSRLHAWYRDTGARFLRPKDGEAAAPWRPSR